MLLVGGIGKWELRAYGLLLVAAPIAAKLLSDRILGRLTSYWDNSHKRRESERSQQRADHIRLRQIEDEVVEKLRSNRPFPKLERDEED
jgi:hypothetical protein